MTLMSQAFQSCLRSGVARQRGCQTFDQFRPSLYSAPLRTPAFREVVVLFVAGVEIARIVITIYFRRQV